MKLIFFFFISFIWVLKSSCIFVPPMINARLLLPRNNQLPPNIKKNSQKSENNVKKKINFHEKEKIKKSRNK